MRLRRSGAVALLAVILLEPGCVYRIGNRFTAGVLDQAIGEDRDGGVDALGDKVLQKQLAAELGHQLGSGLVSGATEITPEQRKQLEDTIDGLITIATMKAGDGVRHDLSPAMHDMVKEDIIHTLSEGMKGELGDSLEQTSDRVVTRSVASLRKALADPDTRGALTDLLSDSFYVAMREGGRTSPAMGDTLQDTLSQNVLSPFEASMTNVSNTVGAKVEQQAKRTERTLQAIIAFLGLVLGVFMLMYIFAQRQLTKERVISQVVQQDLRSVGAAIGLLDEDTRNRIAGALSDHTVVKAAPGQPPATVKTGDRSDDYLRPKKK